MKRQYKPAAAAQKQLDAAVKFALESLEQRVLLSTSTPLLQSEANAVKAGLTNIVDWAETLETFGALAQNLPGVNRSLASVTNISNLIQTKLAGPINALGNTPSPDQIVTALLAALPGSSVVTALTTTGEVRFDVNTTLNAAPAQVNLDLGQNSDALSIDAATTFTLNSAVNLNFTFGLTLGSGLAASEAFFVKLKTDNASNPTGFKVTGSVAANAFNFALGGKVGFLEVGIGDGTNASNIAVGAEIKLGLNDPNPTDGHITLAELMGNSLSALVAQPAGSATGTINASIPVSAAVGTFGATGTIAVTDSNVFDATKPTVAFTAGNPLKNFKNMTPRDAVAALQQLGASLQGIAESLSPVGGIPFLEDTLADAVNFGDEFFAFSGGFFDAVFKNADSYTATNLAPTDGKLSAAVVLKVSSGGGAEVQKTLAAGTYGSVAGLATALDGALAGTGVSVDSSGGRIRFFSDTAGTNITLRFAGDNRGMRQVGFVPTLTNAELKFDSLQTFLNRLNELDVLGSVGDLNADYANNALTFRLRINQAYHKHFEFHFGDTIDVGVGELAVSGHAHAHFDVDVALDLGLGIELTAIGGSFTLAPTTLLKDLNGGNTFFDSDDGKDDFKILLSNGTTKLVNLDSLTGNSTVAQLQALVGGGNLSLTIVPDPSGQSGQNVALRLIDSSGGTTNPLSVQRLNSSLGAKVIGIEGSDVIPDDGLNQITGSPLHGDSFQKHFFLKEGSKLDASASLEVPDDEKINLIAALGILEVGIVDGTGNLSIGTGLVLNDPGTGAGADGRVRLDELLSAPLRGVLAATNAGPANGKLTGNAVFNLNINGVGNISVTVNQDNTNASLSDLVADIQAALGTTSFSAAYSGTPFATKKLGDVIFVGSKDGKITLTGLVGTIAISFAGGNPAAQLGFTTGATSPASIIESGHLTASGSLHLPLTFPGIEFLQIVSPSSPSIDLAFSAGSPIKYLPSVQNIPSTSDIQKLIDFDTADFLQMITRIVALLQNKDLAILNQPLPLLDKSINEILAFADPIVESFDQLMAKIGNLKQALLTELRGAVESATDPNSIRGLIAGANADALALMGGLEVLQPGLALKFADALDSLESAIQSLPDTIDLSTFSLPGRVIAAIGQFKDVISETRGVIEAAGPEASTQLKNLFAKLEAKVYALKRSIPGVQQLSHFLFEALGLRDLIKEDMFTAIKTTVVNKLLQATNAIGTANAAQQAAKDAFQKIHDDLKDVLAPVVNYAQDIQNLDLVALLQIFNNLASAIATHTASGVLANNPSVEDEPFQVLNEALGTLSASFPGRLRFQFDGSTKRLKIGLDVSVSGSNKEPIALDFSLPGDIPVNLASTGKIDAGKLAVGANLNFDFGLALDPADTAEFVFLFPSSRLGFTALLEAEGLKIDASIGGISAVTLGPDDDGTFYIKKDVNDATNHDPATLDITLDNAGADANGNGVIEFSELLDAVKVTPVGGIKLNFPDVAVLGAPLGEPLSVTVPLPTLFEPGTWVFEIPSFDFSDVRLDLNSLFAGIDAFLGFIVNAFESKLIQQLPLVGDDLGTAALVIEDFRDLLDQIKAVADNITEATSRAGIEEALQKLIFDTLGPGLPDSDSSPFNLSVTPLDILFLENDHHDDGAGNAAPDHRDVRLVVNIDEDGADDDLSTTGDNKDFLTDPDANIEANFVFAGEETWNPTFDIGFDAFGLIGAAAEGGIDLTLAYHAEIGVILNKEHGFSLHLNPAGQSPDLPSTPGTEDPELEAGITLALQDGTKLTLDLFFLTLSATNADTDEDGKKTQFSGAAGLDFDFGGDVQVPLLDLLELEVSPLLSMDVFVDLRLRAGIGDNPNLPSIRADLVADWGFDLSQPEDQRIGDLNLALNNLGLDLGMFISNNLKPILQRVNQFLEPVRPLLEFLQLEVPIVSQLYQLIGQGPFTFLDGIALLGEGGETVAKVVGLLTDVQTFASQITSLENLFLEFGDFDFGDIGNGTGALDTDQFALNRSLAAAFGAMGFSDQNGNPVTGTAAKDKLTQADQDEGGLGIDFPLITNPANILKLLLGQDADLITWDIPRLEASFDFAQIFGPIVPPFPVFAKIGGGFEIFLDLFVGMDTRGIRTGVASGEPGDFLKGFYFGDFADGSTGEETPEAGISMYLSAGAELNVAFAKAGVEGGIKAEINADWHDEGSPGKVYLDEILLHLQRGIECIFDLSGELSAYLGAYLEIVSGIL